MMNRPSIPQRPRSQNNGSSPCPTYVSPPLLPQTDSVKLPMLSNSDSVLPSDPCNSEVPSANRLSIENLHLAHQNSTLARELAHSRYTIHALRQIVSQKEAAEQRAQGELKQSLWRVRVLEAVVGRMSEQLVLLMGEQRGGFDEGTDIVGLAREVAVSEFYRQHATLQQRELDAIRGELCIQDDDEYDPEEEEEEDENQHLTIAASNPLLSVSSTLLCDHPQELSGKDSPPPTITITDSDSEQPTTFDSDQSPSSSSSSSDDDSEDYLEEAEEQFSAASARNLDSVNKNMFNAEPTVVVEERPGLKAEVLFARMRIVSGEA